MINPFMYVGFILVPKLHLGTRIKDGRTGPCPVSGVPSAGTRWMVGHAHPTLLSMKRLVGRASAPARRSAQAGKPVPPEELFKAVLLWNAINGAPDILHGGPCPPYSP